VGPRTYLTLRVGASSIPRSNNMPTSNSKGTFPELHAARLAITE